MAETAKRRSPSSLIGLALGPAVCFAILLVPPPVGVETPAWRVAAITTLMAIWWVTEALPLAATALLPAILFPMLGIAEPVDAMAPYAHPLVFLFLGGFMLAMTIERWGLHRRIALSIVARTGPRPRQQIGAFMLATAGLSMWVSNTATAMLMVPIALSMIKLREDSRPAASKVTSGDPFTRALLLAIAYSASIGGLATLIGTPPNAFLAAFMQQAYGVEIGFFQWMLFALPLSALLLGIVWFLLIRVLHHEADAGKADSLVVLDAQRQALGPMARGEILSAALLGTTALAWVLRPIIDDWVRVGDTSIALLAGLAAFVIPVDLKARQFLMDWDQAKRLPWGILLLFGGGLSLAQALDSSGLAAWMGGGLAALAGWPVLALLLLATALVVFVTELASNTATAAVFVPVAASLGLHLGYGPLFLAIPVAIAASCAFMMPVATPPNAIVFGAGRLTIAEMCRAGLLVNLVAIAVIALASYFFEAMIP